MLKNVIFLIAWCKPLQVKAEDMDAYAPKDLLVVTTGSQVRLAAKRSKVSFANVPSYNSCITYQFSPGRATCSSKPCILWREPRT